MKNLDKVLLAFLLLVTANIFSSKKSFATVYTIAAPIEGSQEVPPNPSTGLGQITGTYDDATFTLSFSLTFTGLTDPTTAAHFHGPALPGTSAPIVIGFAGFPTGVFSGFYSNSYVVTAAQNADIIGGLWYVNIHTTGSPAGEIRGQLQEGTLPVELSSFTSVVLGNDVTLNWSTSEEINNSGFDIERKLSSSDQWSKVGNVAANSNSGGIRNYSFSEKVNAGSYNYRLKQIDLNGNFEYFSLSNEVVVGVPLTYDLSQNYPNPFNPTTNIDYQLPYDSKVTIVLYDMEGREVLNLVNEVKSAGYHTVQLNAGNLSSGTYFYRILAQGDNKTFSLTKSLMLIK